MERSERREDPPRVLLIHEPPDGGVSQHVLHLALGLRDQGFAVEVAGPPRSSISGSLAAAGVRAHAVPLRRGYRRPDQDLRAVRELTSLVRARNVCLVHAHSSKAGVLGRIAARTAGVPSVYSPHCFAFVGPVRRSRKLAAWSIERGFGDLSAAIICVCEAERQRARRARIAPAARLHTILQGVPACAHGVPADPTVSALARRGPVVGAINVLRPQKRVDVILEAIPMVWAAVPEAQFVIVGNGPLEGVLRQRASATGLTDDPRFCFLPFVAPSERYLESFDLFVLASDWEGLPIGVLEAMACGVPQVATAVDGTPEAVDSSTGRLVTTGDPAALASALTELLTDPEGLASMAEASRVRHQQRFTVDRMVTEVAALYQAVLGGQAPGERAPL